MLSQNSMMKLERQLVTVREEEVGRPRQREERGAPGIVKEKSPRQNEGSRLRAVETESTVLRWLLCTAPYPYPTKCRCDLSPLQVSDFSVSWGSSESPVDVQTTQGCFWL